MKYYKLTNEKDQTYHHRHLKKEGIMETTKRIPGQLPSTPGYSCQAGESIFDAAKRLYSNAATVDTTGNLPNEHPDWKFLGTVTVRPYETYPVYQIPKAVNPSLYES